MTRTGRTRSRAPQSSATSVQPSAASRAIKLVQLLDQVAALMRAEPKLDLVAAELLSKLQLRVVTLAAPRVAQHSISLPTEAPAKWLDRGDRSETPPEFIKRTYASWLGKGLARADIKKLDRSLYAALNKWVYQNGDLPDDLDLPTKKEFNDDLIARMSRVSLRLPQDAREIRNLYELARRRKKRVDVTKKKPAAK